MSKTGTNLILRLSVTQQRELGTEREIALSDLRQKTVLITGASGGIGKATSLYLASKGFSVIATSRSDERLSSLRSEAAELGFSLTGAELNINNESDVEQVLPNLIDSVGGTVDVLVNNAGYGLWGPVASLSEEEIRNQFETNLFAAFRLTKAVLPGMMKQRSGVIVNVSSVLGRMGTPFNGAYASSKFALEGLSESLRVELWPFGIRVAVVEPGLFKTGFLDNQVEGVAARSEDSPYLPYINRYEKRHRRFGILSDDPVKVSKVIHKIIRSKYPAFRYPVGKEARLGILGARILPERLFQALMSRATIR